MLGEVSLRGAESCMLEELRRGRVTGLLSYSSLKALEAAAAFYRMLLPDPHRDA